VVVWGFAVSAVGPEDAVRSVGDDEGGGALVGVADGDVFGEVVGFVEEAEAGVGVHWYDNTMLEITLHNNQFPEFGMNWSMSTLSSIGNHIVFFMADIYVLGVEGGTEYASGFIDCWCMHFVTFSEPTDVPSWYYGLCGAGGT